MERRGYQRLLIYADREHSANISFLTGFDPRFEEALLIVGRDGEPAVLVGNENWGTAGAAPLPMRRHMFQDFSLPSQPRDRSRALDDILAEEGIAGGGRVGLVGWKDVLDERASDVPAYIVDVVRGLAGADNVANATGLLIDRCRRPAGDQRGRSAGDNRVGGVPDVSGRSQPGVQPETGHDRARGRRPARLERHAAVVPPDAHRRSARSLRPAQPM